MPHGADAYELHADVQTGALLYIGAFRAGERFEVNEVTQVVFDEPLADDLFSYSPVAGEQLTPARAITERMTLAEAAQRVPFKVLVPQHLPPAAGPLREVMYHPPRSAEGREQLTLMYDGSLWLDESATLDSELADLEWEDVQHHGKALRISDPEDDDGYRLVAVELEGTCVTVISKLERPELLDLAASLAPAE